jgi:lipid II:glycine glycyltransferase (peptidoglycan interpeptide bridge formation enzyme)
MTLTTEVITHKDIWNNALRTLPYAHILQTWEWGEFKRQTTGWQPHRIAFKQGGDIVAMASIGIRRIGIAKVLYVPKGAVFAYEKPELTHKILDFLQHFARQQGAIWLKIDPDVPVATGVPDEPDDTSCEVGQNLQANLQAHGWQFSADQVQFRNTICVDLTRSEDEILAAMSQNTRRKVRTAEKKGVTIRAATQDDLATLYALYQTTGERDHFLIRPREYYLHEWRYLMDAGLAHALIAEYENMPIAHVILFHFGQKCWYFYGASSNAERERMPNYALQWAAMQWAKTQGYTTYDMWGAPNIFDESDSMWGVYEFKRGFRGIVTRTIGAWDYAPSALMYRGYTEILPRVRSWLRKMR